MLLDTLSDKTNYTVFFYYCLGNVQPRYRSTEKSIQLLAITKSSVLVKYGANCILTPIMDEIKKLEVSLL